MITLILLTKIYLVAWFISKFQPLQDLFDYLFHLVPEKYQHYKLFDYIYTGVGCPKCLSLWITLIITLNPFLAIGLSYVAHLLNGKK
jgi:hypothetical protein